MRELFLKPMLVGLVPLLAFGACKPDLVPAVPPGQADVVSFCELDAEGRLIVSVKNQGNSNAASSTTTVEFIPGGSVSLTTPAIPSGKSTNLAPVSIPAECFNSDCDFKITVDANGDVDESDEANNTAGDTCIG